MNSRCDCTPRCSDGKRLLVWCILLGAVHMATRPLQPQEVGHTGILGSWAVRSGSHSGVVYEVAGGKEQPTHTQGHIHTHAQIPKIHQRYSPSCITVTPPCAWFQSCLPPPWQPSRCFTRVKLILSGAGWVARAQTGRWERGFQGMQLISIKIPLLGVIRNERG